MVYGVCQGNVWGSGISRQMALAYISFIHLIAPARAGDLPAMHAAMLQTGAVHWELQTMQRYGLDAAHSFGQAIANRIMTLCGTPARIVSNVAEPA